MIETFVGKRENGKDQGTFRKSQSPPSVPLPGVLFILTKARNICMS